MNTPTSRWAEAGEEDPHGYRFCCKRSELALGHLTDDELANAVFLHNHRGLDIDAIMRGEPSSIGLLTAAKERIRWLSRRTFGARDLFWNGTDGSLPEGRITLIDVKQNPSTSLYRIDVVINDVNYTLHECVRGSEARQRAILLEELMDV